MASPLQKVRGRLYVKAMLLGGKSYAFTNAYLQCHTIATSHNVKRQPNKKIELTATHYLCCNKYFFICAIPTDCHTIRSEKGFGIEKKMVILCSQIDTQSICCKK